MSAEVCVESRMLFRTTPQPQDAFFTNVFRGVQQELRTSTMPETPREPQAMACATSVNCPHPRVTAKRLRTIVLRHMLDHLLGNNPPRLLCGECQIVARCAIMRRSRTQAAHTSDSDCVVSPLMYHAGFLDNAQTKSTNPFRSPAYGHGVSSPIHADACATILTWHGKKVRKPPK